MDIQKALQHILKINKSLHTYWMTIENVFTNKEDTIFLQDEMKQGEIILKNLIGLKDEEDDLLCHDPIYNVLFNYNYRESTIEETTLKLLDLEQQLKNLNYYQQINQEELIEKIIKLYYSLEKINHMFCNLFNVQCTSLNKELIEIAELIDTVIDLNIENNMYHDLFIRIIEDQMLYFTIDELKLNLISMNKALY